MISIRIEFWKNEIVFDLRSQQITYACKTQVHCPMYFINCAFLRCLGKQNRNIVIILQTLQVLPDNFFLVFLIWSKRNVTHEKQNLERKIVLIEFYYDECFNVMLYIISKIIILKTKSLRFIDEKISTIRITILRIAILPNLEPVKI